jgi:hypothetical protein
MRLLLKASPQWKRESGMSKTTCHQTAKTVFRNGFGASETVRQRGQFGSESTDSMTEILGIASLSAMAYMNCALMLDKATAFISDLTGMT